VNVIKFQPNVSSQQLHTFTVWDCL